MPKSTRRTCCSTSHSPRPSSSRSWCSCAAEMKLPSARRGAGLLVRSFQGWRDDGASSMGAALAFYTLFSLAPLLLVALVIDGFFFNRSQAHGSLIGQLGQLVGERAARGVEMLLQAASDQMA